MEHKRFETVIRNCSDSEIFSVNRKHRGMYRWQGRYRLVTTCWSENPKKGFDIYKHLDDELDFDKYEYTFIGRSPIQFKNINNIGVLTTPEIGLNLRNSDIFVTATQDDTCSNSLIEAMSRGMPAVGLASGGTPEIIGEGGELFSSKLDVIDQIDKVSKSIVEYENKVDIPLASTVCYRYMEFMKEVHKYVVSQH